MNSAPKCIVFKDESKNILIQDENGEWTYKCLTEEDIAMLEKNHKDSIRDYLLNGINIMNAAINSVGLESIEKMLKSSMPVYVKIILEAKNTSIGMGINIANDNLNSTDIFILGGISLGISIALFEAPLIVSLLASCAAALFLCDLYLYLKDKSTEIWEKIKIESDSSIAHIASLIEENISSLQDFTSHIIHKITSWVDEYDVNDLLMQDNHSNGEIIYNPTHPYANPQRHLDSKDYQSLIELLLVKDSTALDIDNLLHTFPNYLQNTTPTTTPKDSIHSTSSFTNQISLESSTDTSPSPSQSLNAKTSLCYNVA